MWSSLASAPGSMSLCSPETDGLVSRPRKYFYRRPMSATRPAQSHRCRMRPSMGKMLPYKCRPAHVDLQGSLAPWHIISV